MRRVQPRTLFTVEDVNARIPRLAVLLERLQRLARRLTADGAGALPDGAPLEDLLQARPALRLVVEEVDAIVQEVERLGGALKDVRLGLVDFPARLEPGGDVVLLCWQFGEPEVGFWHPPDEGFAGRRPLPGASRSWLQ